VVNQMLFPPGTVKFQSGYRLGGMGLDASEEYKRLALPDGCSGFAQVFR
jgi:hypothetical protein